PSASFTAGWNDVNAVNDGEGRNSGGSQDEVWATWSGDEPDTQWLQYTWEEAVRINGTEIMFWSDTDPGAGTGVSVPESWNIQYLDPDSGEWTNVPDPSGYPTEPTGTNVTSFDAIVTTKLRATFNAYPDEEGTYAAVGVSEWEVYAEAPQSLEPIDVRTSVGELPELPETVTAVYSDGSRTPIPVQWPAVSEDQVAADGNFTITGLVSGTMIPAEATIWVRATPPGQINTIDPVQLRTVVGDPPDLPKLVTVQYNDGSREMLPVTWEEVDPSQYAQEGAFTVAGTVQGEGTTDATAQVQVIAAETEPPQAGGAVVATVTPRCMAANAVLYVAVQNKADQVTGAVTLSSDYGSKTFEQIAPGQSAAVALNTRGQDIPAGSVSLSGTAPDGSELASDADYGALSCG